MLRGQPQTLFNTHNHWQVLYIGRVRSSHAYPDRPTGAPRHAAVGTADPSSAVAVAASATTGAATAVAATAQRPRPRRHHRRRRHRRSLLRVPLMSVRGLNRWISSDVSLREECIGALVMVE